MPGSVVFETAIGLILVFLTASLISSAAIEWLSNKLNKRGEFLLRGLREMLDIPPATPSAPGAQGTVRRSGKHYLLKRQGMRSCLQQLSKAGVELRNDLDTTREGTVSMPAPLADLVLSHPVIATLHRPARPGRPGRAEPRRIRTLTPERRRERMHLASYVSAQVFARSLIDLLVPHGAGKTTVQELESRVAKLPATLPAQDALLALLRDAGDDVDRFRGTLERWYDEQMGRVSGWYKRWSQWRLFIAGVVVALLLNVNTIAIGRTLYEDAPVRNAVVGQAVSAQGCPDAAGPDRDECLARQRDILRELPLPLGWNLDGAMTDCRAYSNREACWPHFENWIPYWWDTAARNGLDVILLTLLGWLSTAVAVSFGAPFWFDALSKLGSLRTAGRRPGENAPYDVERP